MLAVDISPNARTEGFSCLRIDAVGDAVLEKLDCPFLALSLPVWQPRQHSGRDAR